MKRIAITIAAIGLLGVGAHSAEAQFIGGFVGVNPYRFGYPAPYPYVYGGVSPYGYGGYGYGYPGFGYGYGAPLPYARFGFVGGIRPGWGPRPYYYGGYGRPGYRRGYRGGFR